MTSIGLFALSDATSGAPAPPEMLPEREGEEVKTNLVSVESKLLSYRQSDQAGQINNDPRKWLKGGACFK